MVYTGHFENGVVVFDETPGLPDGTEVEVCVVKSGRHEEQKGPILDEHGQTLGQKLMKHAGKAENLPPDAALNHDHYLYGVPKKS